MNSVFVAIGLTRLFSLTRIRIYIDIFAFTYGNKKYNGDQNRFFVAIFQDH